MAVTTSLVGILVALLMAATFSFGADTPLLSLGFSGLICLVAAVAAWRLDRRRKLPAHIWIGVVGIVILGLAQWIKGTLESAMPELAVMSAALACLFVGHVTSLQTDGAKRVYSIVQIGLLTVAIVSFLSFVIDPATIFGRAKAYHTDRLTGPFLSANTAASFFVVSALVGLGRIIRDANSSDNHSGIRMMERIAKRSVVSLLLFLFALTCLLLTGSRGGIAVGLVGLVSLIVWQRGKDKRRTVLLVASAAGLIGLVWLVSGGLAQDRLIGLQTDDAGRTVLWRAAFEAFLEAPLIGHGIGQFVPALLQQSTLETAPILVLQGAAHNLVLQWLVQTGLLGLLLGLAFVAVLVRDLFIGLNRRQRMLTVLRTLIVILGAILLHGMIDYAVEIPAILWWTALLMGLGSGLSHGRTASQDRRS